MNFKTISHLKDVRSKANFLSYKICREPKSQGIVVTPVEMDCEFPAIGVYECFWNPESDDIRQIQPYSWD